PAIPITIKKATASTNGFWIPLLAGGPGFMAKDYPGGGSDVGKLQGCRWRNWWCYGSSLLGWLGRLRWLLGIVTRPYQQDHAHHTAHEPSQNHATTLSYHTPPLRHLRRVSTTRCPSAPEVARAYPRGTGWSAKTTAPAPMGR